MKTICLDPVSAALLTTRRPAKWGATNLCEHDGARGKVGLACCRCGSVVQADPFLSFVTVDRPPPPAECDCDWDHHLECECYLLGPSPWIGQRVAIYAGWTVPRHDTPALTTWLGELPTAEYDRITNACVSDAIVGSGTLAQAVPIISHQRWDAPNPPLPCIVVDDNGVDLHYRPLELGDKPVLLSDQLPLQDWSPGRWALRFADVAPTSERLPWCTSHLSHPPSSRCKGEPVVAPVLSGDDPTYRRKGTDMAAVSTEDVKLEAMSRALSRQKKAMRLTNGQRALILDRLEERHIRRVSGDDPTYREWTP